MDPEPLVRSVLAALLLLESSDDSEIHPDVAVAGMEAMSAELLRMGPDDAAEFISVVMRIADSTKDARYREFYRSVPFMTGMVT